MKLLTSAVSAEFAVPFRFVFATEHTERHYRPRVTTTDKPTQVVREQQRDLTWPLVPVHDCLIFGYTPYNVRVYVRLTY